MIMATPRVLNFRYYKYVGLLPSAVYIACANARDGLRASKMAESVHDRTRRHA